MSVKTTDVGTFVAISVALVVIGVTKRPYTWERTSQPTPTMGDWLLVATGGC